MPVVDVLVTKYTLDDSGYKKGADSVVSSTSRVGESVGAVGSAIAGIGGFMLAGAAAVGAFGVSAMKAAADFDRMEKTFSGAFGSLEKGVQMMKYLDQYATKSSYSLKDLADAATQLAAGGLSVGKYLPIIERFALVAGGGDPEALKQFAGAMLRAKGGSFGEAMEQIRRAGISTNDLRGQGIKVSKSGEINSTPEEFLAAIGKLSMKIKPIADAISESDATTISNFGDLMGRAFRQVGAVLIKQFLPGVKAFMTKFGEIVESGVLKDITDNFSSLAMSFSGAGSMEEAVDNVTISLLAVPSAIKAYAGMMMDVVKAYLNVVQHFSPGARAAKKALDNGGADIYGKAFEDFYGITAARETLARRKAEAAAERAKNGAIKSPEADGGTSTVKAVAAPVAINYLAAIAENTKKSVDLQRIALGSNIGKYGVTPMELSTMRTGRPDPWSKVLDALREVFGHEVAQAMVQARRGGMQSVGFR